MIVLAFCLTLCRPHPNECSGGDLDGDLFFVCWDESLIPPNTIAPMDYIERRPRLMDHKVTLEVCSTDSSFLLQFLIKMYLVLVPFYYHFRFVWFCASASLKWENIFLEL